jgi:hypothetical protein
VVVRTRLQVLDVGLINRPEEEVVQHALGAELPQWDGIGVAGDSPVAGLPAGQEEVDVNKEEKEEFLCRGAVQILPARGDVHGQLPLEAHISRDDNSSRTEAAGDESHPGVAKCPFSTAIPAAAVKRLTAAEPPAGA